MENEKRAGRFAELLTWLMNMPDGREFIYALLDMAGVNDLEYCITTDNLMAYELGRRSVGNELMLVLRNELEDGLRLELLMRQEARARPKEKRQDTFYDQFEGGES